MQKKIYKWNVENKKKLLGCHTLEEAMKEFPGVKSESLRRKMDEFKFHLLDTKSIIKTEDMMKEMSKLKYKNTFFEIIGEAVLKQIKPFEPERVRVENKKAEDEILVALLSDQQVGEKINEEETGSLGVYNLDIFKERLWDWAKGIIHIKSRHNSNTIHIDALGDDLDNVGIYKGQAHHIETGLVKQFLFAFEEMSKVFLFLSEHFDNVVINKVIGNHGRIGQYGENPIMDNIEYLLYKMIEKQMSNVKNVRFNISDSWWMVVDRFGWRTLLSHGDTFKSWMGLSYYGATRNKSRMEDLLNGRFQDAHFDFVEHGHFHTPATFSGIYMNGCFPGINEFSSRLGLGGLPLQKLLIMTKMYGVQSDIPIYLSKPGEKKSLKVYS